MIRYTKGDIFDSETEAIINTVNTVGVMGKGIALQFKQRFPYNFEVYKKACDNNDIGIGKLLVTESDSLFTKYIINFPTKKHWKNPSQYHYIEEGLEDLIKQLKEKKIKSVAIPPLGAGNGRLKWENVKMIIEKYLAHIDDIEFVIYEPQERFLSRDVVKNSSPVLTPVRALLWLTFQEYQQAGDDLNLLVAQKIAYFLQRLGEPLRLEYEKGWYGPYAPTLNKVLQVMNGSFISYNASSDKPSELINLVTKEEAKIRQKYLELSDKQKEKFELLNKFIEGFETPFSLELLATVDWILLKKPDISMEQIYREISNWTERKASLIDQYHIKVAYTHLKKYSNYLYKEKTK